MNHVIETHQLSKQFRDFWNRIRITAVNQLDLQVEQGSLFGLLGPNGSGKTTTLKMLTGLLHPSCGTIRILNGTPRDRSTRTRMGYLPETIGFYPYLNARDTLRFHAALFGITGKTARHRIDTLLTRVGLEHAATRAVGEFSQGMKKRLGLAQALINDPTLLLLDEPTAGLDPAGCQRIKELLRERTSNGQTVVISSHLLADIEDICDHVAILHTGKRIANGRLNELLEQQNQIRFTTDATDEDQTQAIQTCFQSVTGKKAAIDHPRMKLETFFSTCVDHADEGTAS